MTAGYFEHTLANQS